MRTLMTWIVGLTGLVFLLACAGFTEEFNAGLTESVKESIDEARVAIATCDDSARAARLSAMVDYIENGVNDGSQPLLNAAVKLGSIQVGAQEGCTAEDIANIISLYPELDSVI